MTTSRPRMCARTGLLAAVVAGSALLSAFGGDARAAVVYCTAPGIPAGCIVRPTPYAPAARAVVYCTRPGYPVGCVAGGAVAAPAARAVVRPGPGVNAGGPVNRPGLR
ncbi:Uncharacterised protein [Starkeya nomas]|uniref:Uncharacterized protein n=2 Tax=Starkeya nomas TaxID=2666134 RepID=A0A5S9P3W2_9HYPH|nr:Uncharacterised protein [Starkeya nomas]